MHKSEIKRTLQENKQLLHAYGIKKIGLFGSYLRGTINEKSDIDILISADQTMTLLKFVKLEMELSALLGGKVDLVSINGISQYIKPFILSEVEFVEGL